MHHLSQCSMKASAHAVDVGQHQMWAGQSLELLDKQRFLTSGSMGAMGSALPLTTSAGKTIERPVISISDPCLYRYKGKRLSQNSLRLRVYGDGALFKSRRKLRKYKISRLFALV